MGITDQQTLYLMIFGLVLSVAIDLDVLWSSKNVGLHHMEITHQPYFWIVISGGLALIGVLLGIQWLVAAGLVVFLSMMTHMFLDTFGVVTGVNWLAPFSDRPISFTGMRPVFLSTGERVAYYSHNWQIFLRDAAVIGVGMGVLVMKMMRGIVLVG